MSTEITTYDPIAIGRAAGAAYKQAVDLGLRTEAAVRTAAEMVAEKLPGLHIEDALEAAREAAERAAETGSAETTPVPTQAQAPAPALAQPRPSVPNRPITAFGISKTLIAQNPDIGIIEFSTELDKQIRATGASPISPTTVAIYYKQVRTAAAAPKKAAAQKADDTMPLTAKVEKVLSDPEFANASHAQVLAELIRRGWATEGKETLYKIRNAVHYLRFRDKRRAQGLPAMSAPALARRAEARSAKAEDRPGIRPVAKPRPAEARRAVDQPAADHQPDPFAGEHFEEWAVVARAARAAGGIANALAFVDLANRIGLARARKICAMIAELQA